MTRTTTNEACKNPLMSSSNETFKAIADPARREILRLLGVREMSAGQISEHFNTGKPTLSHHLAVLKDAEMIISRRDGQTIWYALNTTVMQDIIAWAVDVAGPARRARTKAR